MDTVKRWALATTFLCLAAPGFAADSTITALPAGTALVGTEPIPMDQSGVTAKTTANDIKTFTNVPAGSDTQAQFNDGGAFGGDAGFIWNKTNDLLTIGVPGTSTGSLKIGNSASSAFAVLTTDADNVFAIRDSTNANTLRIYATADGSPGSNFQRLVLSSGVTSNMSVIAADNGGTGLAMGLQFGAALTTGGGVTSIFNISTSGHLLWNTDGIYDIGASGATRPRTGYFGASLRVGTPSSTAIAATGGSASLAVQSSTTANAAGVFEAAGAQGVSSGGTIAVYQNDATAMASGNRLGLFLFGGASSASAIRNSAAVQAFASQNWVDASAYGSRLEFATTTNNATSRTTKMILGNGGIVTFGATEANTVPALKPSSTTLQARLGDDSAFAPFSAALITTSSTTLMASSVALTDGAAAATATMTNAPAAGNPTKWIPINDNGTTRYIPAW